MGWLVMGSLLERLIWYGEVSLDYVLQMLPCALLGGILFFLLRPLRRRRLAERGLISGPWREGAMLLFTLFCFGLAALTLFPAYFWTRDHWYWVVQGVEPVFAPVDLAEALGQAQLVPSLTPEQAMAGGWVSYMIWANALIFLPVGFFPALVGERPRWWKSLLYSLGSSVFIEVEQLFSGRSTDIDDVILNTVGALLGYWGFLLLRHGFPRFLSRFRCTKSGGP